MLCWLGDVSLLNQPTWERIVFRIEGKVTKRIVKEEAQIRNQRKLPLPFQFNFCCVLRSPDLFYCRSVPQYIDSSPWWLLLYFCFRPQEMRHFLRCFFCFVFALSLWLWEDWGRARWGYYQYIVLLTWKQNKNKLSTPFCKNKIYNGVVLCMYERQNQIYFFISV